MARGGDGNGDGNYLAQARELELARRDAQRIVSDLAAANREIDTLRQQLNAASAHIGELQALAAHQVRTAFAMGAGAGVVLAMAAWGVIALLLR